MSLADDSADYVVPSYRAADEEPWFHFLHGNVPGHQIDFMYRAEVPQGRLTRQHFSHLARLMKYIEPQTNAPYAFAIGNLSRDDTQHEPGHGGLALIFGLRIRGVTDHAGRQDPPFSHGIAAIDRELDAGALLATARSFYQHVLGGAESADWYRQYVRAAAETPSQMADVLSGYVGGFGDLPRPEESAMTCKWLLGGAALPRRIVLVHPDDVPFERLARCACRIAAMLYQSDIRWTSITNGREADVPNGVSIRLIAEGQLTPADEALGVRWIDDVPEDEAEIARALFNASPAVKEKPAARGWRERYSALGDTPSVSGESARGSWEGAPPPRPLSERPAPLPNYAARAPNSPLPGRADDIEEKTTHWQRRSSSPGAPVDRPSVDDEAVTVGAPLQKVDSAPPGNGTAAAHAPSEGIEVSVDEDPEERRASFDLHPPPPAPEDDQTTQHAGFHRETVQLTPAQIQQSLAGVLPFRPPPPPVVAPSETRATPEPMPDFRRSSLSGWRWVLVLAVVGAVVIGILYLLFAPPSAPAQSTAPSAPVNVSAAPAPTPPPPPAPTPTTTASPTLRPSASAPPPASAPTPSATSSAGPRKGPLPKPPPPRPKPNPKPSVFDPTSPQTLQ